LEEGADVDLVELDRRLQYGPGMRVQRAVEAGFLVAAFFASEPRLAWVTFAMSVLQTLSPRAAPVALAIAVFAPVRTRHAASDLYFDLSGSRGACAASALAQAVGLGLLHAGQPTAGWLVLTMPTASFILSPTIGFCAGCAMYVGLREILVRARAVERCPDGRCDVEVHDATAARRQ
jgi:hypothetical protein